MDTLFKRIGGKKTVIKAVDDFYAKVLVDDRVKDFFDNTDMEEQKKKQKAFLSFAFGGRDDYTGKDMRDAHADLLEKGLDDSHVDVIIELLAGTLREMGIAEDLIAEVGEVANSVRDDVLGR